MRNVVLVIALLVSGLFPASVKAAASGRVGYVETARVLRESKAAIAAREKLEGSLKEKQAVVDAEKVKVDALKAELDKGEKTLSQSQKEAKAKEILDRSAALQKMVADARKDVGEADQASTNAVVERMKATLEKLRKAKGYDLIVEKASVLSARDDLDLTGELIKAMDAQR